MLQPQSVKGQRWQLLGNGYAIEWIDLDGRRSSESLKSFDRWLSARIISKD